MQAFIQIAFRYFHRRIQPGLKLISRRITGRESQTMKYPRRGTVSGMRDEDVFR